MTALDVPLQQPVADAAWHRLSPRMLLIHPILELGRALPALVGIFFAGSGHDSGHYWTLGAAGLVMLYSLTRWFTTRLQVTEQSVTLRHGLVRRRTVTTSRDRIRTVDLTSHLLHRALGLARVVIGTGTNDRKGRGGLVLDGLTVGVARRLRDDLLHPVRAQAPAAAPPVELARLDRHWIGYAPFTLSGVITGVVIWGLFWRIQGESRIDLLRKGPLREVTDWFTARSTGTAVVVLVAAAVVFVAVTSTVGYVLAFWNFRLARHPSGTLEVTRGLLTTRATSIERRRLAGVHLSAPLPLRWVHATRTTAVATGLRTGRGSERGGEVLLPPAPAHVATAVATDVLDGTAAVSVALHRHPRAARRRRMIRSAVGATVLAAAGVLSAVLADTTWPLVPAAVALAAAVPIGLDRYANLGHARADGYLVTQFGSLVRRRSVLAESAVVGWTLRTTFLQRRQGLTTLVATTAAGAQGYPVLDLAGDDAVALADAVTPGLFTGLVHAPAAHRATAR